MGLASLTVALTTAGGYAISDYIDRESDAIVRPERPIPSNQISPIGAVQFSAVVFLAALGVTLAINPLTFGIVAVTIVFLVLYPSFFKQLSGFLSNILVGLAWMTIPLFSEAAVFQRMSAISFSFIFYALLITGDNVLKDVVGTVGDTKVGYSTLAAKRGTRTAVRVGAFILFVAIIAMPLPYVVGAVSVAYLLPIALFGCILFYAGLSMFRRPDVQNVEKLLRTFTASIVLFPIALMAGVFL